jgi:ribulose-phosphate 3-epimerase
MTATQLTATELTATVPEPPRLTDVHIAPSILAADFTRLGAQVGEVLGAGARMIHCDVMDGHFVPPITFGALIVSALSDLVHDAGALLDVHLMIERPEAQLGAFARAGADVITIHAEATSNVHYTLSAIRDAGCRAGLAINPGTPSGQVAPVGGMIDLALCMTVDPGWGGQQFIAATRRKISRLRELLPRECAIEVDGGIDITTGPECVRLGANLLVAGSAVLGRPSPADAYRELAAAAGAV